MATSKLKMHGTWNRSLSTLKGFHLRKVRCHDGFFLFHDIFIVQLNQHSKPISPSSLKDSYLTISSPTTGEFRDRGSKFLAYTFPIITEEDWQSALEQVKKEHPKARHHCFAYRLGLDFNNFRANLFNLTFGFVIRCCNNTIANHF